MDDRKDDFLKLIFSKHTINILRYLNEHKTGQFKDLMEFVNAVTLYNRMKQLLHYNLITHHVDKKELRREWYELTEKGRKVLQILESIIELFEG